MESEKNANLLEEYHELYELQRKRLEIFVRTLTEERDLWGSASYILALKVTDHHKLNVAKRLHLHERAWSKLARHFSLTLSQKDSEQVSVACFDMFFMGFFPFFVFFLWNIA